MTIRHLAPKDLNILMRFYDRNYSDGHIYRSQKYITWQYASSPYLKEIGQDLSIIGAVDGDKLIGILEYVPQLLTLAAERVEPAADFRHLFVEETSSAKHAGMDMVRFFMEEFNLIFGIGARTRMVLDAQNFGSRPRTCVLF